jgi:tetratricopeptide (TPR) repeat protein
LAPASLVPLNVLVNEHRLYVAGGFLAIGGVAFLTQHHARYRQTGMMKAAATVLLLILALLSHQRSEVWNSELRLWTNAVERAPNAYRAHMHLGGAQEAEGAIVAALDSYRQATRLGSRVAETHYNLGNALRLTRHAAQARQSWERSLQLDPTFLDALLNLAGSYQEAGDWEQTWALLNRAEAFHPHSPEVWRRKGVAFFRGNDDVERARSAYDRALELDPTSAEAHHNLANLYYGERRFGDAARQYTLALRYNDAHHGAAYNLAELKLSEMGDPEGAEQICRQMLAHDSLRHTPGETKFFYLLARVLDVQGQMVEALANYRIFLSFRAAQAPLLEWVQNRIEQLEASHR